MILSDLVANIAYDQILAQVEVPIQVEIGVAVSAVILPHTAILAVVIALYANVVDQTVSDLQRAVHADILLIKIEARMA